MSHELVEEFYKRKYKRLIKQLVARRIDPYDAEDIVQEAFTRALKYISSFNSSYCEFGNWFGGILNRCQKDFYHQERIGGMGVEVKEDTIFTVDDFGENNKTVEEIKKSISKLRGNNRYICYLYFLKGYTPREIVRITDVKADVVRDAVRVFKARMITKYGER